MTFSSGLFLVSCSVIVFYFDSFVNGHGSLNNPLPRNNNGYLPIDTEPGDSHGPSCLGQVGKRYLQYIYRLFVNVVDNTL